MIRNAFQNLSLPALGMGCMRLPTRDGEIDREATARMVDYAMAHGVNYFDTAWPYHEGKSESVMGEVLSRFPRESYFLATKFPGSDPKFFDDPTAVFDTQLEHLGTDYVDFYLFHNVAENTIDRFLDPEKGVAGYLIAQKRAGRIRHLGFSCHGTPATLRRFLDALGTELEFCQIQLNWLDWTFQQGREKVELLREYGLPVWVMEPVRGGRLVELPEESREALNALRPGVSGPEWAFRFLQSLPEVTVTLSGMSNMAQLEDNIRTYESAKPLTAAEWDALQAAAEALIRKNMIPCTGCRYCVEKCPQQIDIPSMLAMYNDHFLTGAAKISHRFLLHVPEGRRPGDCLGCRGCEQACPQNIRISEVLAEFSRRLV